MSDNDDDLASRARAGDRPAFEQLVRRTARLVYARHVAGGAGPEMAEDLTQETYLLAWRSIARLNDPKDFRGWLMTLARSAEIDAARHANRKKRWGRRVEDARLLAVADGRAAPPQAAEQAEARDRALAALRELPEEYRLPLTLRYLGGADYDEIARQLALTNGSLRGLLHRGMALLRKRLKT